MSEDLKGTVFNGRYTILGRIGAGGMATIYRARDEQTSAFVAIKILSRDFLARNKKEAERNLRRFKREAEILRLLDGSPHVVGFVEHACSEADDWFIAMELLDGEQLRHYIGRGRSVMGAPTFLHYACHLVEGLKEIHSHGILHRDLAPDNVILVKNEDGILVPKYLDFGIGKSIGDELDQVTQMLTIMGKPQYFSPEQARGLELTTASDIYSMGVLLYEMVTGYVPLEIHGIPDFRKIQKDAPLPIESHREGQRIPEELQSAIMAALAKRPEERPLADELLGLLNQTRERLNAGEEFLPTGAETTPTADHTKPMRVTEVELYPGDSVSRYEIKDTLGKGGMGSVYLAWDPVLHREVAVKVATKIEEEKAKKMLLREARASSALRCENIVTIYDAGTDGGTPYIAMEYVKGLTLSEIVEEEGPLSGQRFWELARGICEGLWFAHDREEPVIHRDLKPANMLVHRHGIKITDFGISKVQREASSSADTGAHTLAEGTAAYMSPEQANNKPVDHRSDLYGLGCVLYVMATGRTPFQGNQIAILYQHSTAAPTPPSKIAPDCPAALDRIILKLLSKKPEERHADANEVIEDLRRVFAPAAPSSPWFRSPAFLIGVAATIIAVLAIALNTQSNGEGSPTRSPFELSFVQNVQSPWEEGSTYFVKEPRMRVIGAAGAATDIEVTVTPQGGGKPQIETITIEEGRLNHLVDLPPMESTGGMRNYGVSIQDKGGDADQAYTFKIAHDTDNPKISVITHGGHNQDLKAVDVIETLRGGDLSFIVTDEQAGFDDGEGSVIQRWAGGPNESSLPGIRIAWGEGDMLSVYVVDRSGRARNTAYQVVRRIPRIRSGLEETIRTANHAIPIAIALECPPYDLKTYPLPTGRLVASVGERHTPLTFANGTYEAEVVLPRPSSPGVTRHQVTFKYDGQQLEHALSVVHDSAAPVIALTYSGSPARTLRSDTDNPDIPFVLKQGQNIADLFTLNVRDDDAWAEAASVAYADGDPVSIPISKDGVLRLPETTPAGATEFPVDVRVEDLAGNASELRFRVKRLGVAISRITVLGRRPTDGVIWIDSAKELDCRIEATNVPARAHIEFALDDLDGAPGERQTMTRDGNVWTAKGLSVRDDGTGLVRQHLRVFLVSPPGDSVPLRSYVLSADTVKPTWTATLLGQPNALDSELTLGAFHPIVLKVRDQGILDLRSSALEIETIEGDVPQQTRTAVDGGVDIRIAAPPTAQPGRYRIRFAGKDLAGNLSRPLDVTVAVVPPQIRLTWAGSQAATRPRQFSDRPVPTREDRLPIVVENAADGARGRFVIQAVISPGNGGPNEPRTLKGLLVDGQSQNFSIDGLAGSKARIGLSWVEQVGDALGQPVVFDSVAWFRDTEDPKFELLLDSAPFNTVLLRDGGLKTTSLARIALRVTDAGGFSEDPIAARREFPEHHTAQRVGNTITWHFSAMPKWDVAKVDIDVVDLAGNKKPIRFSIVRAKDHPELDILVDMNGAKPVAGADDVRTSASTKFRIELRNDAPDVAEVRLTVVDKSGNVVDRVDVKPDENGRIKAEFNVPGEGDFSVQLFDRKRTPRFESKAFEKIPLRIDHSPPMVKLHHGAEPAPDPLKLPRVAGFLALVTDRSEVKSVEWSLTAESTKPIWKTLGASEAGRYTLPQSALPDGRYQLVVAAADRVGNRTEARRTVIIKSAAPIPQPEVLFNAAEVRRRTGLDPVPIPDAKNPKFWIAKYEVTVADYKRFMDAYRRDPQGFVDKLQKQAISEDRRAQLRLLKPWNPDHVELVAKRNARSGDDQLPARFFTVPVATAYALWAGGRLPTVDEWRGVAGHYVKPNAQWPIYQGAESDPGLLERKKRWANIHSRRLLPVQELEKGSPFPVFGIIGNASEIVVNGRRSGTMGGSTLVRATSKVSGAQLTRRPYLVNRSPDDNPDVGIRICWSAQEGK